MDTDDKLLELNDVKVPPSSEAWILPLDTEKPDKVAGTPGQPNVKPLQEEIKAMVMLIVFTVRSLCVSQIVLWLWDKETKEGVSGLRE